MAGDFNHFAAMAAKIQLVRSQLVRKAAFDVEAHAKAHAAVATGFMRSAIYTVTSDSSNYGAGGDGGGHLEEQMTAPSSDTTAYIVSGADYGIYVELGTVHMAAQPYMAPAADEVRPSFIEAWQKLEDHLK